MHEPTQPEQSTEALGGQPQSELRANGTSVFGAVSKAAGWVIFPSVPFHGALDGFAMQFRRIGVAGPAIVGLTFVSASAMLMVAERFGAPGLAAGGAGLLFLALVSSWALAHFWRPKKQQSGTGADLLRKEILARGAVLVKEQRWQEAIGEYNSLIDRFGSRYESEVALLVAEAMFAKGKAYAEQRRYDVSVIAFDTLIAKYGNSDQRMLLVAVANGMLGKAAALIELGEMDEAVPLLRHVMARFGRTNDDSAKRVVRLAQQMLNDDVSRRMAPEHDSEFDRVTLQSAA